VDVDKKEFERILMAPDGEKKLAEMVRMLKQQYGGERVTTIGPTSMGRAVEPRANEYRPTSEEQRARDNDHSLLRNVINIGLFIPELKGDPKKQDPKKVLSICIDRFRNNSSEGNRHILLCAINNVTYGGALDSNTEKLVKEAIDSLSSKRMAREYERR
jgi:hypothetical protein